MGTKTYFSGSTKVREKSNSFLHGDVWKRENASEFWARKFSSCGKTANTEVKRARGAFFMVLVKRIRGFLLAAMNVLEMVTYRSENRMVPSLCIWFKAST